MRARVCALYRQGAGTCVFGLSHRPCFPQQSEVALLICKEFQTRISPTSNNWWPALALVSDLPCAFDWSPASVSWNVSQKRLKEGNRRARSARLELS